MLSEAQKKHLRGKGHQLKPVVMIGDAGLTKNVRHEIETALAHHELIKIKVRTGDRNLRDEIILTLVTDANAELVQRIGNTALLFRANPDDRKILLPKS